MTTEKPPVDMHDPAGMARWLRERSEAARFFTTMNTAAQRLQFLELWQVNVLPHLAFRFEQAAEMVERMRAGLYKHACICGCSDPSPAAHSTWCHYREFTMGSPDTRRAPNFSSTGE